MLCQFLLYNKVSQLQIHISTLFQILFPYRSLQSIEQDSPCYSVGSYQSYILYIVVYICQSQCPNLSLPLPLLSPLVTTNLFSTSSVTQLLFCKQVHLYHFFGVHIQVILYSIYLFLTSLSMIISRSIHITANDIISFFFYGQVTPHCIYAPHLYPFLC